MSGTKLYAARPKDIEFVKIMIAHDLLDCDLLSQRIEALPVTIDAIRSVVRRLDGLKEQVAREQPTQPDPSPT